MMQNNLQHIYQAWQQGNDHYVRDWAHFVEWAASITNTTSDSILKQLENCHWFKKA
jgi:hypothetical protein